MIRWQPARRWARRHPTLTDFAAFAAFAVALAILATWALP